MLNYLKGLTHVTFTCKDFLAMRTFYHDTLGLKELFVLPYNDTVLKGFRESGYDTTGLKPGDVWIVYLEVAPRQFVELFNLPYNGDNETQNTGFHHFCLRVENIVEAARELEAKGVTLYNGPKWQNNPFMEAYPENPKEAGKQGQCGSLSFYIQDPEGNEIEIMQYTADSRQVKSRAAARVAAP